MYYRNYKLQKTWLDRCLKGSVSEYRLTVSMLKGPNTAEFYMILSLSLWQKFSWEMSLLVISEILWLFFNTWTPMTSSLFFVEKICGNQFESNYLRNKKHFPNLLLHFWNLHQNYKYFEKKGGSYSSGISKIRNC